MLPYFPSGKNDADGDLYCNGHCIFSYATSLSLKLPKMPFVSLSPFRVRIAFDASVQQLLHPSKALCKVSRVKVKGN